MNPDSHRRAQRKIDEGVAAWERGAYQEALEIFDQTLRDHPDYPDVHNWAGVCRAMEGDAGGALEAFEHALELAPTYAEAHFNRGIVLNDLGRHDEAERAFRRAQELDTRDGLRFPSELGHRIAHAHAQLGDLYLLADSPGEAVAQYRAALDVRPRFLDVREKLAKALLEKGEAEAARQELERVVEEDPGFTEARLRLGVSLERLGDREGAVREWKRVLSARPGDRRGQAYLASVGVPTDEEPPES